MSLTLILGPMASGKTTELINIFSSMRPGENFALFQSIKNVRDENIKSRNGEEIQAQKIHSLKEIEREKYSIIGIDEIHMFSEDEASHIHGLLRSGAKIIASGLDMDYRGKIFLIVKNLIALNPVKTIYKQANCEKCNNPNATHTQILKNFIPVTSGLPPCVPDDGTYEYKSVCKNCFKT